MFRNYSLLDEVLKGERCIHARVCQEVTGRSKKKKKRNSDSNLIKKPLFYLTWSKFLEVLIISTKNLSGSVLHFVNPLQTLGIRNKARDTISCVPNQYGSKSFGNPPEISKLIYGFNIFDIVP